MEDLRLQSAYDAANPNDEEHAWFGITMQNVQNAWARRIEFRHFAGGAVALWENTQVASRFTIAFRSSRSRRWPATGDIHFSRRAN